MDQILTTSMLSSGGLWPTSINLQCHVMLLGIGSSHCLEGPESSDRISCRRIFEVVEGAPSSDDVEGFFHPSFQLVFCIFYRHSG